MPDLITHLCTAQIARRAFRRLPFALIALGAILPDLLSRPFHILLPATYRFVVPLHSPLVCLCYCAAISALFSRGIRRSCFLALCSGAALHLAVDALQYQVEPTYLWLFPFSWKSWWIGFFWPEQALYFLPATIAVTAVISMMLSPQSARRKTRSSRT